jgi:hypothetical protein
MEGMRNLRWPAHALALVLLGCGAEGQVAPTAGAPASLAASPAPPPVAVEPISTPTADVDSVVARIQSARTRIAGELQVARGQGAQDRSTCLNEKLSQLGAALRRARDFKSQGMPMTDRDRTELGIIGVRAQQLDAQAQQCS